MKATKKIISVILCIAIIFSFSACSFSATNGLFTSGVLGNVQSFDPLKAKSDIEKILSTNCFEGLLRFDENGSLDLAGATAYTVGKNGTSYTFKLNPDAKWYISKETRELFMEHSNEKLPENITAEDYIYGIWCFREAYPYVLQNIKSMEATEDFTLVFTLTESDYDFPSKLASHPIYPRSWTFCDALGESFGSTPAAVLTNGHYYIKSSDPAETIMERSSDYSGNARTMNKQIVLYTTGVEEALEERFNNGSYSIYTTRESAMDTAMVSYSDVWGLCFNCKTTLGSSQGLRFSLLSAINYGIIVQPSFAVGKAGTVIPTDFLLGDVTYADFSPEAIRYASDTQKAQSTLDALMQKYKKESYTLRFAVPTEMEKSAKTIIKDWQSLFGEKIKIELTTFDKKDALAIAEKGEYEMAILPLSPQNRTPQSLFDTIASAPCYFEGNILNKTKALSPIAEDRFNAYHSAEKALVENSVFVPLFYEGTTLRLAEDLQGIYIADGGEQIYFYGGHQVK